MFTSEDLARVGKMLADRYGLRVVCRGSQCFIDLKADPPLIVLPSLPDIIKSDTLLSKVRGFLDHEVGHLVGKSDCEAREKISREHGVVAASILNALEDIRVEQLMADLWIGCGVNLRKHFIALMDDKDKAIAKVSFWQKASPDACQGDAIPTEQEQAVAEVVSNPAYQIGAAIMEAGKGVSFSAWLAPDISAIVEPYRTQIGEVGLWARRTADLVPLALELYAKWQQAIKQRGQQQPQPAQAPPQGTEGQGEGDGGQGEQAQSSDGSGGRQDSPKKNDDEEKAGQKQKPGKGKGQPEKQEPEPLPADAGTEEPTDQSQDAKAGGEQSGQGQEGQGETEPAGDQGANGQGQTSTESGVEQKGGGAGASLSPAAEDAGNEALEQAETEAAPFDLGDETAENVTDHARKAVSESEPGDPVPYLPEADKIVKVNWQPGASEQHKVQKFREEAEAAGGPCRQRLQQILQSEAKTFWQTGRKRGFPDPRMLAQLASGVNDRVMRRHIDQPAPNTACYLLIDGSGSMADYGAGRIDAAMGAAAAFTHAIERGGHFSAVGMFQTAGGVRDQPECLDMPEEQRQQMSEDLRLQDGGFRTYSVRVHCLKDWTEPYRHVIPRLFAGIRHAAGRTPLGGAIMIAGRELRRRSEHRKVLMCFTDGEPQDIQEAINACKRVESWGIQVVIVGICGFKVSHLHTRTVVNDKLEDLGKDTIKELAKALGC